MQFQEFDDSYLQRLRAGDFRTQEHFVAYFSELIQIKLRSRLRSAHDIEDVRQETFVRVLTALRSEGGIRQADRLGAFVNSTCNNVLLEKYRAPRSDSLDDEEQSPDLPDTRVDVLGFVVARETQQKVRQILEELPEKDRRILKEIFIEEREKDDVCRDYGVDRNYLRVLLHRAKLQFKSQYLKSLEVQTRAGARS